MSKHLFQRLEVGYKGTKSEKTMNAYTTEQCVCMLSWCDNKPSKFKGVGSRLCEYHQSLMREYGGPGRTDRPYTFNKQRYCEKCGFDPWKDDPLVGMIDDELVRDRLAWGTLIVDHMHTQRDGGNDFPENCQTLCVRCNQHKTTLACDSMPRSLYNNQYECDAIAQRLKPFYTKLFG